MFLRLFGQAGMLVLRHYKTMKRTICLIFTLFIGLAIFESCGSMRTPSENASAEVVEQTVQQASESVEEASEEMEEDSSPHKQEADKSKKKADAKTWKRSKVQPNSSRLEIGNNQYLPLKGSQMMVQIDGFRARVLIDYYYYNDNADQLEGTFKLRLPTGASPYFFAFGETIVMDEDKIQFQDFKKYTKEEVEPEKVVSNWRFRSTKPKQARIVPKEKAAFAYTVTSQRRVDPALMEWAGADIFNCRVFPLFAKKMHRIVVGYDVNLLELDGDKIFKLALPLEDVPIAVDFDIADTGNDIQSNPNIKFKKSFGRYLGHLENPTEKNIELRWASKGNVLLQYRKEEEAYFATRLTPQLPNEANIATSKYATFLVDVSLSANPDKFNIWLKLLESILDNNRTVIENFSVVFFNVETFQWQKEWTKNTPENISKLLTYCNTLALEGATDLSIALAETNKSELLRRDMSYQNIFLLSDAQITWGDGNLHALSAQMNPNDRLFAFKTGLSGTDSRVMQQLTRQSGGAIFNVIGESQIKKASTAFRKSPWKIKSIELKNGQDIIAAGRPNYLYEGQQLLLAGRGKITAESEVRLNLSKGSVQKTIKMPFAHLIGSDMAKRMYGQIATNQLESFGIAAEKYAISYATHFKVPGQTCSFLMLESETDYQRFNIKPEQEKFVVKSTTVNGLVGKFLTELGEQLANAKANFENWVNKLTQTAGMKFQKTTTLEILMDAIPENSFSVSIKGLTTNQHQKNQLSNSYLKELAKQDLSYDKVTKESEKRLKDFDKSTALKALSSLIEKNPSDGVLMRDIAFSAMEWGLNEQAYQLFKRVLTARPYEPQTYHALGQLLKDMDKADLAVLYYEIALATDWLPKFGEFKTIAAIDYMRLLKQIQANKVKVSFPNYIADRLNQLSHDYKQETCDLMVTIMWNTDNTDIDLHVVEPTGEECFYKNSETKIGGALTQDVTNGYGPEMYRIQDAKRGRYHVKVKYFSSNQIRGKTRSKVYATIYKNWGKADETVTKKVIMLRDRKEKQSVMTVKM